MKDVFSEYVHRLTSHGESLDRESYDEAREYLRAVLVTEMRKRGLWTSSPAYLGVTASSWSDEDGLEELVDDAYAFVFVDRLRGLVDKLRVLPSIGGMVLLNVRHFVTERQRKADPLGYRVFGRLRAAVERLLEQGRIFIRGLTGQSGEPAEPVVCNATVLAFSRELAAMAVPGVFDAVVIRWNNHLMPDLVVAESRAVRGVVERLANEVVTLPGDGVRAFRLGDLAKALKDDARSRWQALWQPQEAAPEDGTPGAPKVPITQPEEPLDWLRFRAAVLECVERAINAIRQAKRQRDLWRLWLFLRSTRLDASQAYELPSWLQLGRELDLPRERVAQLFEQVKQLVCRCIAGAGVDRPGCALPADDDPVEPAPMVAREGRWRKEA